MQLGYGLWACALCLCFLTPAARGTPAGSSTATKSTTSGKKSGFSGDPARKRGLELGFDYGLKAGKEDKAQKKKADPQAHQPFQNPEKYYRYEFGSRANFISGFKSGFLGGYQQALGKKVTWKADGSGNVAGTLPTDVKTPTKKPVPPVNPAADAL